MKWIGPLAFLIMTIPAALRAETHEFEDASRASGGVSSPTPLLQKLFPSSFSDQMLFKDLNQNISGVIQGDAQSCSFMAGAYRKKSSSGETEMVLGFPRENIAPGSFLALNSKVRQTLLFEEKDKDKRILRRGLALEYEGKWYLVSPKKLRLPQTLMSLTQEISGSVKAKNFQDLDFEELKPNKEMTEAALPDGSKFSYDSHESYRRIMQGANVSGLDAYKGIDNPGLYDISAENLIVPNETGVRVAPEMYELLKNPEFTSARDKMQYTRMIDMIYAKALDVARGDARMALEIALVATDMRARGPCGAIQGFRGKLLVPSSVFNGEVPLEILRRPRQASFNDDVEKYQKKMVVGRRLDATQHFFGYALLTQDFNKDLVEAYSKFSKTPSSKDRFFRYFRSLHFANPDTGEDDVRTETLGPANWVGTTDLSPRPPWDVNSDLHYNRMGVAFGTALKNGSRTNPSWVISDPKYENFEETFGLRDWRSKSDTWQVDIDALRMEDTQSLKSADPAISSWHTESFD